MPNAKSRGFYFVKKILTELGGLVEDCLDERENFYDAYYGRVPRWVRIRERSFWEDVRKRRALRAARRQNYLDVHRRGTEFLIRFTQKGFAYLLKQKILNAPQAPETGRRLVIAFDIPEVARSVRDSWRDFLKDAGFAFVQRSVWSTKKDVRKELELLAEATGVVLWIQIIETGDENKSATP